jgi:hypothetical protein
VRGGVLVILEYGQITIEADARSLDAVLHEIGFPQAFRTGAPLRITFSSAPARMAVLRRLRDANYVVVESKAGRGELRLYPEDQDQPRRLSGFTPTFTPSFAPPPFDHPRLVAGPVWRGRGSDPALVTSLRHQLNAAGTPAERARALDELALYADEDVVREAALELLAREQSNDLLSSALDALDNLAAVPVRPILEFIRRERRSDLRVQAIELVGRHGGGDPSVRELLGRISSGPEDERVRRAARIALEDLTQ